jgi:3-phosphoshikimate 1-carboxyvinyltransferase
LPVEPLAEPFDLSLRPPGSKSMTCRAYVIAALADGASRIERPLRSDDTDRLLAALEQLGAGVQWQEDDVVIEGCGGRLPRGGRVDLGDGGTPARFMMAVACLAGAPVVVDGSNRMRQRPVAELVELLQALGARIEYVRQDGGLPIRVTPSRDMRGGALDVPTTASSQFISALLLIGPWLDDGIQLRYTGELTSPSYVELTELLLEQWGAEVGPIDQEADHGGHRVAPSPLAGRHFAIEPDASSAVYWWTAALMTPGARARVPGIGRRSAQPDVRVLDLVEAGGDAGERRVRWGDDAIEVVGSEARPALGDVCAREAPDGAMCLAVYAASADRPAARASQSVSRISGLRTLRVKESDRIAALANELTRVGCSVEMDDDSIVIDPTTLHDRPVVIETYRDHRMAMAFAVLGLHRPGISIADPGCVNKSYPTFWDDLARLSAPRPS